MTRESYVGKEKEEGRRNRKEGGRETIKITVTRRWNLGGITAKEEKYCRRKL